jgi:hypothetical protein
MCSVWTIALVCIVVALLLGAARDTVMHPPEFAYVSDAYTIREYRACT